MSEAPIHVRARSRRRRRSLGLSACALLALGGAGCASIPEPEPVPKRLFRDELRHESALAFARPRVTLSVAEGVKGVGPGVFGRGSLQNQLLPWLRAGDSFLSIRAAEVSDEETLQEAWRAGDDLILEVELQEFETTFDGHTWLWIPNLLNYFYWIVPAWFVATEEYSLDFEARVVVRSVDSGLALHEATIPIHADGVFGDFQRGWQLLGPIYPNNDAENWINVARALLPASMSTLGRKIAIELREPLRDSLNRGATREAMRKRLALNVGVSRYRDTNRLPVLRYAEEDARRSHEALGRAGIPPRMRSLLLGDAASLKAVRSGLDELERRARPGDTVVLTFAGYGHRDADGFAQLLLPGESEQAEVLTLAELATRLARISGHKLVVFDCGFDGQARSLAASALPVDANLKAFAAAAKAGVIAASAPGHSVEIATHLKGSLFGHHWVAGLRGAADDNGDAKLTAAELWRYARAKTVTEAAYFGATQSPVAAGILGVTNTPGRENAGEDEREGFAGSRAELFVPAADPTPSGTESP